MQLTRAIRLQSTPLSAKTYTPGTSSAIILRRRAALFVLQVQRAMQGLCDVISMP